MTSSFDIIHTLDRCPHCNGRLCQEAVTFPNGRTCQHCRAEYVYTVFLDPRGEEDQEEKGRYNATYKAGGYGQLLFLLNKLAEAKP